MRLKDVLITGVLTTIAAVMLLNLVPLQTAEAAKPLIQCCDCSGGNCMNTLSRYSAKYGCKHTSQRCVVVETGARVCNSCSQ